MDFRKNEKYENVIKQHGKIFDLIDVSGERRFGEDNNKEIARILFNSMGQDFAEIDAEYLLELKLEKREERRQRRREFWARIFKKPNKLNYIMQQLDELTDRIGSALALLEQLQPKEEPAPERKRRTSRKADDNEPELTDEPKPHSFIH